MEQKESQSSHQAQSESPVSDRYRRLQTLRSRGLNERFYSLDNPEQNRDYRDTIAELDFYRLPYETVVLEGNVIFLFLSDEVVDHLGIEVRRNEVEKVISCRAEIHS